MNMLLLLMSSDRGLKETFCESVIIFNVLCRGLKETFVNLLLFLMSSDRGLKETFCESVVIFNVL